jgi:nicotinamide-nucleotide amidase
LRASFPQISLRLTVEGKPGEAERKLEELAQRVRAKISEFVFAEGEVTMEEVVGRLLMERNIKLAVAESCTGGLIGHRLTNVPGSSNYLIGDLVTYSNQMKTELLGVSETTLRTVGAVSEECVREMATGARRRTGAEVAIATSGVAGPDGGTPDKPVGTVCLGLDSERGQVSRRYQFRGTRDWIKLLTSQVALDWLRRYALDLQIAESALFRR